MPATGKETACCCRSHCRQSRRNFRSTVEHRINVPSFLSASRAYAGQPKQWTILARTLFLGSHISLVATARAETRVARAFWRHHACRRAGACAASSARGPRACADTLSSDRATGATSHAPGHEPPRWKDACRPGRPPPTTHVRSAWRCATSPAPAWPPAASRTAAAIARHQHRTAPSPACSRARRPRRARFWA